MFKRLIGNAAALAIGGAVAQLAFISIEIAIARQFLSGDYGIFSTIQAISLTGLIILDLGMTWWAIESGSRKPETIPVMFGTTTVLKFFGFLVLWPLTAGILSITGYENRAVAFFTLYFVFSLTMAMQDSLSAVYTARQEMTVNALYQGGAAVLIAVFVAITIFFGIGLFGVGAAYVAGGVVITTFWFINTLKHTRPRLRLAETKEIIKSSYLYGLTGLLVHVFRKGDILLLSVFSTMPQVGIYAAASKLLDFAYKIPLLGTYVVSPEMFKQEESDQALFRQSADLFLRVNIVAGCILSICCYYGAEWLILTLFGKQFAEAVFLLRILSISMALKFLYFALQTILTTQRQHATRTQALGVSTVCAAFGYAIMIPQFGAIGAAATVVFSESLLVVLYYISIRDSQFRKTLGHRLLVAFSIIIFCQSIIAISGFQGMTAVVVGVFLCIASFATVRFFRKSEIIEISARISKLKAK